ncbi:type VI secretion system baseplate subunit TssE [Rubrivirga sp.]|uniref:type VI secretion system baseplate subunit TssE n=1 Tax=Rubrivirga sp. TaxID=1885344 RepID=UPI003C72EAD6
MDLALFDILEGRFGGTIPVESVSRDEHRLQSVVGNLERLFNTRQGSVPHLPDYGLPDLASIQRDAPTSTEGLRVRLREAVIAYEPRLNRVRVETQGLDAQEMRTTFIISGEIAPGQRIRLETVFESQEAAHVRPAG